MATLDRLIYFDGIATQLLAELLLAEINIRMLLNVAELQMRLLIASNIDLDVDIDLLNRLLADMWTLVLHYNGAAHVAHVKRNELNDLLGRVYMERVFANLAILDLGVNIWRSRQAEQYFGW